MIKWWSRIHSDYLQSYHIEVLALNIYSSNLDDTPWQVFQFFDKAEPLVRNRLWHDVGYADDYLTYEARLEVLKRITIAKDKSRDAWFCIHGSNNNHAKAIGLWRQIFGDQFPSYG
jgi:hypothetical protein